MTEDPSDGKHLQANLLTADRALITIAHKEQIEVVAIPGSSGGMA
ncbi:MAG: hypothetical protein ACREN8_09045 [Candidatus Dormibacteraceae bacterium]